MGWLFGQTWIWILIAFVLGLVLGFLLTLLLRKKKVEVTEERIAGSSAGASSAGAGVAALAADKDDDDRAEVDADQPPADETPTGRIPVLSADVDADADADTDVDVAAGADADVNADAESADGLSADAESDTDLDAAAADVDADETDDETDDKPATLANLDLDTDTGAADAYPGSAKPNADGSAPSDEYTVKGNLDSMLFHTTESPYYGRTKAEVWFTTAAAAEAAGFAPWSRRVNGAESSDDTVHGLVGMPAVEAGPYPGSAEPTADGSAPSDEYTVKGNLESMLYHSPASAFYPVTAAEIWFTSEETAEEAGFTAWNKVGDQRVGTPATGSIEAAKAAGAAKTAEASEASGPTEAPEATGSAETADAADATVVTETAEATAVADATDATDVPDAAESADATEPAKTTDAADTAESVEATNVAGATEPAETADAAKSADATESATPRGLFEPAVAAEEPHGPGSANPLADGSAPSGEYTVKGNADSMLFHTSDSPYYNRTRAEVWFKSPGDAEAAGFTGWNRKASKGIAAAQALAKPVVEAGAYPGSAKPSADGSAPSADFTVKGNADSMLFHTIASPYYPRTKAEVWFKNEKDAEAAGFTAWNRRR